MRTEIITDEDANKTVLTYDEYDRHIRTTDYDAQGQITCDIVYELDASGNVIRWLVYGEDGLLFKRFERRYNEQGLAEDFQYDAAGQLELRTVEAYDENNRFIVTSFNRHGQPID